MQIKKRHSGYSFRKRVPGRFAAVERRREVVVSLHTDSEREARTKADLVWTNLLRGWEARLAMREGDAAKRFAAAREIADRRGYAYLSADRVMALPEDDRIARLAAIQRTPAGRLDEAEADALIGLAQPPALTVTGALDAFWGYARENILGKSEDQVRRWRHPRVKAVAAFVAAVGDKGLDGITRDDMLDFRQALLDRIEAGEIRKDSANKDLGHLAGVLKLVNLRKRLGLDLPLGDLAFRSDEKRTRPPLSAGWITGKLLAPGALDGMNDEARGIVLLMVNTGLRHSEAANLTANTIRLDYDVPHVEVAPEGRQVKSSNAKRTIPLLGVSLDAMRAHPEGFPRYRASPATLSATVNAYLRKNGLLESDGHTIYGLRHGFEDRMLAAGIDERVRRDLMGHVLGRQRYGAGASLAQVAELLAPVAL